MLNEECVTRALLALRGRGVRSFAEMAREAGMEAKDAREACQALERRGCVLEWTPGEGGGVELSRVGLACWRDVIEAESRRRVWRVARRAVVFRETASTNDICLAAGEDVDGDGLVVLADEQRAGRGRRGKTWTAKAGQSLLLSVLLSTAANLGMDALTLRLGLACAEALERILGRETELKWPNDVLVGGRKIAGALVETRRRTLEGPAVLGVGINVAQSREDFPEALRTTATSIYQETGRQVDRLEVALALLERMEQRCVDRVSGGWLTEWKRRCQMIGERVVLRQGGEVFRGRILDIDFIYGLSVAGDDGSRRHFSAQTTSIEKQH